LTRQSPAQPSRPEQAPPVLRAEHCLNPETGLEPTSEARHLSPAPAPAAEDAALGKEDLAEASETGAIKPLETARPVEETSSLTQAPPLEVAAALGEALAEASEIGVTNPQRTARSVEDTFSLECSKTKPWLSILS